MMRFTPDVLATLGRAAETATSAFASLSDKTRALVVLNASGRHIYAGTVPVAEVARRRAANKVARRSRAINRGR